MKYEKEDSPFNGRQIIMIILYAILMNIFQYINTYKTIPNIGKKIL